jgi:hypothetical protein
MVAMDAFACVCSEILRRIAFCFLMPHTKQPHQMERLIMFGMRADKSCLDFGLITFFFILFSLQSVAISQTGNFPPTERTENDPKQIAGKRARK